ncbi:GNAT family N-acetyltransferase [Parachitinimonas caeni]|uniref:N-acetyltransferase n=1 Tax=Parachitinimonas caeni TaxID=3031301 RepID=A0ABT7E198_9NEIS|nr:N-acetyltransferase [Parachitinimonas caeni]MDK2126076.1 N-acetyltransferase [Parachitinimonas caeni]
MLKLKPMTEAEYAAYCDAALASYAESHVKGGRWTKEEAIEQAWAEHQQILPQGLQTPHHYLYTLFSDVHACNVGILWFADMTGTQNETAFVYDIEIKPEHRRHGFARMAFLEMEKQVKAIGLKYISLHVFAHNHGAVHLYEKLGYQPTNIRMRKALV